MELFRRGKIKADIIENEIEPLQQEKEELEAKVTDLSAIDEILDLKIGEFSSESIKNQLDRFEEMLNDDNHIEMRNLVREFIHKITLDLKKNPKSKKWKRHVRIDSFVRALTMTKMASPTGFESRHGVIVPHHMGDVLDRAKQKRTPACANIPLC